MHDLDWVIKDRHGKEIKPIGFGFPVGKEVVLMNGQLESGTIHTFSGGNKPLLALIFVAPKESNALSLIAPYGKEYRHLLDKVWIPKDENSVYSYKCGGSIRTKIEGENWKIGR